MKIIKINYSLLPPGSVLWHFQDTFVEDCWVFFNLKKHVKANLDGFKIKV